MIRINEFQPNPTGTDPGTTVIELKGEPGTFFSGWIISIEGDDASGSFDRASAVSGTFDANGLLSVTVADLENPSFTLLLSTEFNASVGSSLDLSDAGAQLGTIHDALGIPDASSDEGYLYGVALGGADFNYTGDEPRLVFRDALSGEWYAINDPDNGQAFNINGDAVDPGTFNFDPTSGEGSLGFSNPTRSTTEPEEPETPETHFIHQIQGSGSSVAITGEVSVQGVVTAVYDDADELKGFFIQEEDADVDADSTTSEGIFVYLGSGIVEGLSEGQVVTVSGVAGEYFGMSQIDVSKGGLVTIDDAGNNLSLVTSTSIELPASGRTDAAETFENVEGMLVHFTDTLVVSEYYELARTGQIVLQDEERAYQYTQLNEPDAEGYAAYMDEVASSRIVIDDLNNAQNSDEIYYPGGEGFSIENYIRGGDQVEDLTGVLHWSWAGYSGSDVWVIRPTEAAPVEFTEANLRTEAPEDVGGRLKVASFNVLNLFATIDDGEATTVTGMEPRGADSEVELQRQLDKIVAALSQMDADVIGLIEIENDNDETLALLVDELNTELGSDVYDFVPTGVIGEDAIKVAFIYDTTSVRIANDGAAVAVLDTPEFVAPLGTGDKNRPALAVTFEELATGAHFTAVNNHLKSKGSAVTGEDPGVEDGQGNGSETRKMAADVLADWLATNPTGAPDEDVLILGDLNAYAKEEPLDELREGADDIVGTNDDFTDLAAELIGDGAYSYVFDGQLGTLDYALANQSLKSQVTGITQWHINADEVNLLDYNDSERDASEASYEAKPDTNELYADDPYRSSDHDPVIVGLDLTPEWNLLRGEDGRNDRIKGTDGSDLIMSLGGRVDRLWGMEGEDYFALGNELYNGVRETDMIMDFEGGVDSLILLEGTEIESVHGSGRAMVIFLEGDRDMVHLLGTNLSIDNLNVRYESVDFFS